MPDQDQIRAVRSRWALFGAVLLLGSICVPTQAHARGRGHIHGARVELHGVAGWYAELGFGGRLEFALLHQGFIRNFDDEFALTLGADVILDHHDHHHRHYHGPNHRHDHKHGDHYHWDHRAMMFPIAVQWDFIIRSRWSFFPELGMALHWDHHEVRPRFYAGGGARWHFGHRTALVFRFTSRRLFNFGIAF